MTIETLELIEQALEETLQELHRVRDKRAKKKRPGDRLSYWVEDECTASSEQILVLSEMIVSPLQCSLRKQLHTIGCLLYREVKSTEHMRQVAEWVASLDVVNYEFRINALDSAFEGIGEGEDVWRC
jgi:hypothetical protein